MLLPENDVALKRLSRDASDYIGWTVSSSAIVQALVRYAEQQPPGWTTSQLFPLVEREIASGTMWGSKKKGVRTTGTATVSLPSEGRSHTKVQDDSMLTDMPLDDRTKVLWSLASPPCPSPKCWTTSR